MKRFFQRLGMFFTRLFGGFRKVEAFLTDHVDDALDVVTKIKAEVDHPGTLLLVQLLPDRYGDQVEKALTKIGPLLEKALIALGIGNECLNKATLLDKVVCFTQRVREMSPAMRDATYAKLAALYTQAAANQEGIYQPNHVVDAFVQLRYADRKNQLAGHSKTAQPHTS